MRTRHPLPRPIPRFATLALLAAAFALLLPLEAALGATCGQPKGPGKVSLELLLGEVEIRHDRDSWQLREVISPYHTNTLHMRFFPMGLAEQEFHYPTFSDWLVYREPKGRGHCVSLADVKVRMGFEKFVLSVSSAYPEGTCEYDEILKHEQEHARIYRESLQKFEPAFKRALRRVVENSKAMFVYRMSDFRATTANEIRSAIYSVMTRMWAEAGRRNDILDHPENNGKEQTKCKDWRRWQLKSGRPYPGAVPLRPGGGTIYFAPGFKHIDMERGTVNYRKVPGPKFITPP